MNQSIGLSKIENEMFTEIEKVFKKYSGNTRRFGLFEMHTHFPLGKNEVLYETNDPVQRTHHVVTKTKDELGASAKPTQWIIEDNRVSVFQWCCDAR
jgi:hypothetical protein